MKNIQMVDLHGQYLNIKLEVNNAIQEVIDSSAFINGPQVKAFKAKLESYLSCQHAIPCANGTDALQIALMALDLQAGDEVILPDFTFIATAEVVALLKLKPVFVDVDPNTFLIDIHKFEQAITKRTKAVIPVHLFGQCANISQINEIAKKHKIAVIEDNAQAFGADVLLEGKWLKAGTVGDIGCTSFFPSKNLGCYGDGGAIFTNNNELGERLASIANHGAKVKYYHDIIGTNSRLDTLQAAILLVKVGKIDAYNKARQEAASKYNELLQTVEQVKTPQKVDYSTHVYHQYTLLAENRNDLKNYLAEKGIPAMIYYPVGMHNQKAYKSSGDFRNSDELCSKVISLPMHTELDNEQQEYIAESISKFYNS